MVDKIETDNPFEKVLDRLREKGWHKGGYGGNEGPNCLAGAALRAEVFVPEENGYWGTLPLTQQINDIIHTEYGLSNIPEFNDHPDTTFSDVERVLEKAAVKWEEERVMRDE